MAGGVDMKTRGIALGRKFLARLRLVHDRRGATVIILALTLSVLIGVVGLGVDTGVWMMNQGAAQGAADAAAYSAAIAATSGGNPTAEAKAIAASMNFTNGVGGVTVSANNPPTQGAYTKQSAAWEVVITAPQKLFFSKLFLTTAPTVSVRAVAMVGSQACILGLDPSAPDTVLVDNNASVTNPDCALFSDSSASSALSCNNNCTINSSTFAVGGDAVANNGYLEGARNVTGAAPAADPYASVSAGSPGACTATKAVTGGSIQPGNYCGGINVENNSTLNMASGVYYVDTQFNVENNVTLNANPPGGVTIIINGTYSIGVENNVTLNITAQSTGPFAGIAIMGPRNSSASVIQTFGNNIQNNIQGAIYFPSQTLEFANNANFSPATCTQLVADKIQLSNNGNMGTDCTGTGVSPIGTPAKMVE